MIKRTSAKKSIFQMLPSVTANTAHEMALQAGLDFEVEKQNVFFGDSLEANMIDGKPHYPCTHFPEDAMIVRMDNGEPMGIVGANYGVVQYLEALEFTEILVKDEGASYISGGPIAGGRQAFVVMKTNDFVKLDEDDNIDCYFYVTTSHDGTASLKLIPAPLRKASGSFFLYPSVKGLKFKHSKHVRNKIAQARKSIKGIKDYFTLMTREFNDFRALKLSDDQIREYFRLVLPGDHKRTENMRDKVIDIYVTSPSLKIPACRGTLLGAYFAVVEYIDNYQAVRKSKVKDEMSARLATMLDGPAAERKAKAFALGITLKRKLGDGKTKTI